MMKIYLCEDSKSQLDALENLIQKCLFINHLNGKIIYKAQDPAELLQNIRQTMPYLGLYYLDVDLKAEIDGFTLAEKIREIDPRAYIVFITVHQTLRMEPYNHHIEALDFIWKSDRTKELRITSSLQKALSNYEQFMGPFLKKELILRSHNDYQYLETDKILYLEAVGKEHKVNIYMENEFVQSWRTLNELMGQLPQDTFFRCHHSYIVNRQFIQRALKKERKLVLATNCKIPYSFRRQSMLFEWLKNHRIPIE